MRKRPLLVALAVAGVALVAAFLVLLLRSSADGEQPQLQGQRLTLVAAAKRKALPDVSGPALTPPPARLRLHAPAGKPAFVSVWASWCVPCREEAPTLARLWREHRAEVQFLGIDVEDTRGDARAFVHRYGLNYPHVFDRKATLAAKLGFFGLPTSYLVDRHGRIAAKLVGKQRKAILRQGIKALIREASGR